ncbi:MAG: T9SS type A sorting domain-containing protein [Elusimicrobiales bacterium]|nr:T9SS type A sorting domain-containing protein [Elusimicrobiales bacterium]
MRINAATFGLAAFLAAGGLYSYAPALISSRMYRILISEQTSIGNTVPKTGGSYSLLGSTGQLGFGSLSGAHYTVNWGAINSWRPPQASVTAAHVYPNPCTLREACNGVTFTRLTLNAVINIYTISGEKVRTIEKTGNIDSVGWDLRGDAGQRVASGLYLYVIKGEGSTKKGKIIIAR